MNVINKKVLIITLIAVGIFVLIAGWMFNKKFNQITLMQNLTQSPISSTISSIPSAQIVNISETKIYRNTEFGFEFQYPKEWELEENSFHSPFSKFNLQGDTSAKDYNPFNSAFLVNVVTPDFIERQFADLKSVAQEIRVGGIDGKKYKYKEQFAVIDVILPFGQYQLILGTRQEYEDIFNQILATFKFIK
ncbi:MAG: hypothetical protein Athens101426_31 [Parcubacteria group bacterium Athens1014_26]|nr:MAG: hypothetical protein Athens101426_31 [Parcubacteria group bacterium Athens1014_26]